jgi:hypothetical protein
MFLSNWSMSWRYGLSNNVNEHDDDPVQQGDLDRYPRKSRAWMTIVVQMKHWLD